MYWYLPKLGAHSVTPCGRLPRALLAHVPMPPDVLTRSRASQINDFSVRYAAMAAALAEAGFTVLRYGNFDIIVTHHCGALGGGVVGWAACAVLCCGEGGGR